MCLIRSKENELRLALIIKGALIWSYKIHREVGLQDVWFNVSTVSRMYLSFCVGFNISLTPPQLCRSETEGIWFLLVGWEEVGSWQPLRWGSFFLRCPLWLICCKIPWPWDFFFLLLSFSLFYHLIIIEAELTMSRISYFKENNLFWPVAYSYH